MGITYMYSIWDLDIQKFVYIGKSNMPPVRFRGHMKRSANLCLRKLVKEKGADSFELIILERTNFFKLRGWVKREKFWIGKLRKEGHPLCNKNDGGGGVTKHTEEARARIGERASNISEEEKVRRSEAWLGENNPWYGRDISGRNNPFFGRHHTEEAKRKNREAHIGKKHTEEAKAKTSKALSGENNPRGMLGKCHTEETREKMRKAHAKRDQKGENNPMYGKHHTEETKAKQRKALAGKPPSEKTIAAAIEAQAKPYPAFYNVETKEYIPAGRNLKELSRERSLNYDAMLNLKSGNTKQSRDRWKLATISEIERAMNENTN
ncbi:MAG: GIY-YIG nuclease family protein [Deltaproteobacteria bacterium]|nr:GIY-YIG nuclease family protein [Deltaproteobacteria bacterium]